MYNDKVHFYFRNSETFSKKVFEPDSRAARIVITVEINYDACGY